MGSGSPVECQEAAQLAKELAQSWSDDLPPLRLAVPAGIEVSVRVPPRIAYFPLLDCLSAARLLIVGAGYNTVHEAAALHVPALFRPRSRLYDDQAGRVSAEHCFHDAADLWPLIRRELAKPRPPLTVYANGATQAAALIQSRCATNSV
jgi:hypothetical protein